MSEITTTYLANDNHRYYGPITAKAAKLAGSGTKAGYSWVITEASLPAAILDTNLSTAGASGGPTIRFSTDVGGVNQIACHIEDFTPAAGGAGGGATAEIWIPAGDYTGGSSKDFYIWWVIGGSQTQPARGADYGSNNAHAGLEFVSHDGGLTDWSANESTQVDTGTANTTVNKKIGLNAREHGGGDKMETELDNGPATSGMTFMAWTRRVGFGTYIMSQENGGKGLVPLAKSGNFDHDYRCYLDGVIIITSPTFWPNNFTFYHTALTYSPSAGYVAYGSGSVIGSATTTAFPTFASTTKGMHVGGREEDTARNWDGTIDEPWAIHATLDSAQILTIFRNQDNPGDFWDLTAATIGQGEATGGFIEYTSDMFLEFIDPIGF